MVTLQNFVDMLGKEVDNGAVLVADAGSAFFSIPSLFPFGEDQNLLIPGAQAIMGWTLPACIGAKIAEPDRQIIGVTGDGSFQFNIQELQTIVHHKLGIKLFVLNNGGYSCIKDTARRYFDGEVIGCGPESGVSFPNLRRVVGAYGIDYVRVEDVDNDGWHMFVVGGRSTKICFLKDVLESDGPVVVEVMMEG